jgi:hypothetical protein
MPTKSLKLPHISWGANFGESPKGEVRRTSIQCEVRRTPQSGSWGIAPRGTITPLIDQEEEAIDRGFLEEALARPGG